MRSVLIAIDFVKDVDNSFKVLELNTGIAAAPISIEPYFNKTELDNLIAQSNITEIELILLNIGPVHAINTDYPNDSLMGFGAVIDKYYSGLTITKHVVDGTNQITPNITDTPNKLIIRQSYDSTALIDETYAKDNFEFLKLLYDESPSSIVNTYINHPTFGFDMIGTTIRDNGNYPNYIIKQRFPTMNYSEYPKVFKIETQQELENLKNNLPSNTLLQEYVFNPNDLEEGKLKTYRSIGLAYGPNLDIINLIDPFVHTNSCTVDMTVDTSNTEIEVWERPKYLQKYTKKYNGVEYHSDSNNKILKSDGTLVSPSQLSINDTVKVVDLYGLPTQDSNTIISSYTGTTNDVFSNSPSSTATIKSIQTSNQNVWIRNIFLNNGLKFSDINDSKVLIKRDNILRFISFAQIELTDEMVVVNKNTNVFESVSIDSESYIFTNEDIYTIDVEDIDLYLTMDESTSSPDYFIIQHNAPVCRCWRLQLIGDPWDCGDPCDFPDVYTGFNKWECISLGLGWPYCEQYVCCRSEPVSSGSDMIDPCSFCLASK